MNMTDPFVDYVKKPVVIRACQYTKEYFERKETFEGIVKYDEDSGFSYLETLEGYYILNIGDMIIRGVKGEYYPCKPDIFALTYEVAK